MLEIRNIVKNYETGSETVPRPQGSVHRVP